MVNKLRKARESKGLTQEEMAKLLGYKGKSAYCHLEKGNVKITLPVAEKISEILDIDVMDLFFNKRVEVTSTTTKSKSKSQPTDPCENCKNKTVSCHKLCNEKKAVS